MTLTAGLSSEGALLGALGAVVRALRAERGLTLRQLAERSGISERFLSDLEAGKANVSILRLADVARALGVAAADLVGAAERGGSAGAPRAGREARRGIVALLGLRGAGKSTIGARAAQRLGVPFVELDLRITERAGMSPGEIFDIHGAAYYRRLERAELDRILASGGPAIVATAGSLVTEHATFEALLAGATTVWLKASAEDHYARVLAQGDTRPMANRKDAMHELKTLLRARRALYERAHHVVDTSKLGLDRSVLAVLHVAQQALAGSGMAEPPCRG
jgi:XRE family aerobic/anaerobic benzoate catabolism transcriptional regulator